jgi:hypothetical protein
MRLNVAVLVRPVAVEAVEELGELQAALIGISCP